MLSWKGGSGSSGPNLGPAQGIPRISPCESEFYKNKVKKRASETLHLYYSVEISLVLPRTECFPGTSNFSPISFFVF